MNLRTPSPLSAPHAREANRLLRRMARIWRLPGVAKVKVVVRPGLRRTLGRFSPQTGVIEAQRYGVV